MNGGVRYDFRQTPLVTARVASLPVKAATDLLETADPIEATRAFLRAHSFARAAIAVASPSLASAVDEWLAGKPLRNAKTPLRAVAYLLRMATRTTPFGLFAGVGTIGLGESTTLRLDPHGYRTSSRPDMDVVARAAACAPVQADERRIVTNQCAFLRGDRLVVTNLALTNDVDGGTEQRDVSMRHTKAVAFLRDYCVAGAHYGDAVTALCKEFAAQRDDAVKVLDRLEEAGVVISELRVTPIGDPIARVAERLEAIGSSEAPRLRGAIDAAARFDLESPLERDAADYERLRAGIAEVVNPSPADLLQVDLRATFTGTLGTEVMADAEKLAELLMRSSVPRRLSAYRQRFTERYEGTQRLVPLLELVDNELGLGFPEAPERDADGDDSRSVALTQLFAEAARENRVELDLSRGNLDIVLPATSSGHRPRALEVGFQLDAASPEAVAAGDYRLIGSVLSERSCGIVGRFAHLLGEETIDRMRTIARRTQRDNEIVAELVYAPVDSRSYNVCVRPRIYEYEIRAGIGEAPSSGSLSPADLWVGIDDERFYLWSKSLGKRIDVRETHVMTTVARAPNLCRFLALLFQDGLRVPGFDLGPAEQLPYIPRLTHGRVVISTRRWRFNRAAFGRTTGDFSHELERLRNLWDLPRYVYLCEGDNRLLVDLDSSLAASLVEAHAGETALRFAEVLPSPERNWLPGPNGAHAVEFIAEAVVVDPEPPRRAPASIPLVAAPRTVHGPGSRWSYAKLYLGSQGADDFLVRQIAPLVDTLREEGAIDRWFFLRYADPAFHLRLRVHAANDDAARAVRERVVGEAEAWLRDARIVRSAIDTYDPEYERYGGVEQMEAAEAFFSYDSDLCLSTISDGLTDTGARIEMAAATFDASIRMSERAGEMILNMYGEQARRKLEQRDRDALRRITSERPAFEPYDLDAALAGEGGSNRLAAYVHLHCNRLGLDYEAEARVATLLRALALSRKATSKAQAGR